MQSINWTKVGVVGGVAAAAVGTILGSVLADGQADQVIAWADAGKGALLAVAGMLGGLVAAMVAARKK